MAVLTCQPSGRRVSLGVRCLVGRAAVSQLTISDPTISAEHASIYFDGSCWKVRDLASRNGTFVDERPVAPRQSELLEVGTRVRFGPSAANVWRLDCAAPPGPSAVTASGVRVVAQAGVLWLPEPNEPETCIRCADDGWFAEAETGSRVVADGDGVRVGGEHFTLELPSLEQLGGQYSFNSTVDAGGGDVLQLTFTVSRDEEQVSLAASFGPAAVDFGGRAHNYALLLLARRRQEENALGVSAAEVGWVYSEELFEMLGANREAVNLQLWRATQCFKKSGLPGEHLVERRLNSSQIRLGIADFSIVSG